MYLSKLEIVGFKSFAHKTLLKFDSGMTSIVGPNGCGKTNVVDAIRWALGEQKAGTLRSDVMENVIFNGTRTRKPLGMAEVSLTIENTKGILPTEYQEVTITRRLFRSGESEYLLNKTQCRLKDIIELFMDTGMGANAYSVIELKMIETILSDRTEERRKLFEEAAGVTKYKTRRKEALRRLDQVSADLSRVDDIVKEVTKSVASLERQAEKAKKFTEVSGELKTLEVDLLEREYAVNVARIAPLKQELESVQEQKTQLSSELSKYEALLDVIEREAAEIEEQVQSADRSLQENARTIQTTRETIIATEERIKSLGAAKERAEQDEARLEKEQVELRDRLSVIRKSLETATERRATLEAEKQAQSEVRATAESAVRERRAALQKSRDEVYSLLNKRNERSSELERRRARIGELDRRLGTFAGEYSALDTRQAALAQDAESLRDALSGADAIVLAAEAEVQQAQDGKDAIKNRIDELQNNSFTIQNEIGKKLSKIEFFTGLVEQGIGAGEGTQFLLSQSGWSSTEPVTVADAFNTEPEYRAAFESALGEAAHYLIVPRTQDAYEAVEVLKHSQKGKATLVALDRVPERDVAIGPLPGTAQPALALARFHAEYRALFTLLLGSIAVVESIEEGWSVLDATSTVDRCVTLAGEVISRNGFVKGGSKKSTEGILIGKREQIQELEVEVENLKAELERCDAEIANQNAAFEAIQLKEFQTRVRATEEERRQIQVRLNQVEYEQTRAAEQRERLQNEESRLNADRSPLDGSLETIETEVQAFEAQHGAALAASLSAQSLVEEAERLYAEESRTWTDIEVRFAQLQSEVGRLDSELRQTERAMQNAAALMAQRNQERQRAEHDLGEISGKLDGFRTSLTGLESAQAELKTHRDEIAEIRQTKQAEARAHRESLRAERAEHDKQLTITHELELKIQELESKVSQILERAKVEFEIDELPLRTYPEGEGFSFGDARERVRDLKQKVRNLGAVNLLAYDEFVQESERLTFLTTQRKDLTEAQRNLTTTIAEINDTATKQFLETFEVVRQNFREIFRSLFTEGDDCDLNLEADKDPLEAQVEIVAKPRGKRPHSIELLSGGEKTMTAIALLFAIYLVKPSPFCILDEVDAPLDDSNIDRFLAIIRKFAVNTQFIVVTHNKRTMAAADALYGVTQEEDGVSKIVSVRLRKDEQFRSQAAEQAPVAA